MNFGDCVGSLISHAIIIIFFGFALYGFFMSAGYVALDKPCSDRVEVVEFHPYNHDFEYVKTFETLENKTIVTYHVFKTRIELEAFKDGIRR